MKYCAIFVFLSIEIACCENFWAIYRKNEAFPTQTVCNLASNDVIIEEFERVTSDVECLGLCSRHENCSASVYDVPTNSCILTTDSNYCVDDPTAVTRRKVNLKLKI